MDITIQPGTSDMKAIPNTDAANSTSWMPSVTAGGNTNPFTVTTVTADSCYIPIYPYPAMPTYPSTTIVNWPSCPVMHPHACPIFEGRQTVKAGFYRDTAEDKGPQKCRTCKDGLVYLP